MFFSTVLIVSLFAGVPGDLVSNEKQRVILVGESSSFNLILTQPLEQPVNISVGVQEEGVVSVDPTIIEVPSLSTGPWLVNVTGVDGGRVTVVATVSPHITNDYYAFIRVTVQHSETLAVISIIIGWIYFAAWTISFYPQVYENFIRKSVIGLNFDFEALNIVGFTLYAVFNFGLFWIPEIEQQYFRRHPRGMNPVQVNDIVYAIHAPFATMLIITQCLCYERGNQTVSKTCRFILAIYVFIFILCLGLAFFNYIEWLDFLYDCSYIKLTITIIKYIPQAFMNYKRQSTVGWSIGAILLDFTGSVLSMGQMIINSYNYNDWVSIFGDPTKFGLGLFSLLFCVLFLLQQYVFYRNSPPKEHF